MKKCELHTNLKEWYSLYTELSSFLYPIINSILEKNWERVLNQGCSLKTTDRWEPFLENIKRTRNPKQRFLNGVSFITFGTFTEDDIKTIRPFFPTKLDEFKNCFFPFLSDEQYLNAQYAIVDLSYESLLGAKLKSLTSRVIESEKPYYYPTFERERNEGVSIRPDVDETIGFNSLVYIPILPELWVLFFSPVSAWFIEGSEEILKKEIDTKLSLNIELLKLYWNAIQFLETKTKEMWFMSFERAVKILYHPFKDKVYDKEKVQIFYEIVKSHGLEILRRAFNPEKLKLNLHAEFRRIVTSDGQLSAVLEDDLKYDLNNINNKSLLAYADPSILSFVIRELIVNARKYGKQTNIVFNDEGDYSVISFKTISNTVLSVEEYIQLRYGLPLTRSNCDGGMGLWLSNKLLASIGGYLKVEFKPYEELEVNLCLEKVMW